MSGDVAVDTRSRALEYESLPTADLSFTPPQEPTVEATRKVGDVFEIDIGLPTAGERVSVYSNDDLSTDNWQLVDSLFTNSPRMRLYLDTEGRAKKFYRIVPEFSFEPGEVGFVDEECDLSTLTNTDSDNYYLRQNNDHENLDIYYNVPARLAGLLDFVRFRVFKGDTGEGVPVGFAGTSSFTSFQGVGNGLHETFSVPLPDLDSDPGFFVVRMEVVVNGVVVWQSPIEDADSNPANGWQCPQECLAVWDPIWRHRPRLHLGRPSLIEDPYGFESGGGVRHPISPLAFLLRAELWRKFPKNGGLLEDQLELEDPSFLDLSNPAFNTINHYLDVGSAGSGGSVDESGIPSSAEAVIMHTASDHQFSEGATQTGERRDTANEEYLFAQYWLFYDYSNSSVDLPLTGIPHHEGDLEYAQVCLRKWNPASRSSKAEWMTPYSATASQHYYGQTLAWDSEDGSLPPNPQEIDHVPHDGNGRPFIYVADGTHATYFAPGGPEPAYHLATDLVNDELPPYLGTQIQYKNPWDGLGYIGPVERTSRPYERSYQLQPMPEWFEKWQGRWGRRESSVGDPFDPFERDGPHGPPHRNAYQAPPSSGAEPIPVNLREEPVRFHNFSLRSVDGVLDDLYIPEN
ncbi:hypothetical protein [Haloferula sp. A504]|uniref:hypothetical protein n=1 Tax=Haloferula sp. A504 TaxID=3373601 RepID=UPI0031CB9351|nr:hypothetical protein [Verrucomicrobiaceae bacterium E54]